MKFITLSEREIKTARYSAIREPHIVISISGSNDAETIVPNNQSRAGLLHIKFDDVEDLTENYLYFDRQLTNDILEFVERLCSKVSLIIVQCQAGISRSVAVASALSKIINGRDDEIFTKGIPNMLVYTTILEYFFGNPLWSVDFPKITMLRNRMLGEFISPSMMRMANVKNKKRMQ